MKNLSSHASQSPRSRREIQDDEERNLTPPPLPAADDDDDKPRCDWDFRLSAVVSSAAAVGGSSDAIGVIEFDQRNSHFATGGIARKIRIYTLQKLINESHCNSSTSTATMSFLDNATACEFYMCTPAKLSSLKWKPGSGSRVIGSGDYDGVVFEYDLEKRVPVFERDEHGGRRVWSVDYSYSDPNLGASGSDDGTMQMWDTRCRDGGNLLAPIRPDRVATSPVCSVEFNPFGGHLIAVGCADSKIYGYDWRRAVDPVFVLDGHRRAVTYAKFLDSSTIISSAIDGCLMMWHAEDRSRPIRTYRGHVNSRRFVGLSAWGGGGLLSCGSEDNRVYVYDKRWRDPVWVRGFGVSTAAVVGDRGFVSGVCWRQGREEQRCTLVVGGSDGVLQVFEGERKD